MKASSQEWSDGGLHHYSSLSFIIGSDIPFSLWLQFWIELEEMLEVTASNGLFEEGDVLDSFSVVIRDAFRFQDGNGSICTLLIKLLLISTEFIQDEVWHLEAAFIVDSIFLSLHDFIIEYVTLLLHNGV